MWQDIAKFGKKLVERGLVESHFGNISVRIGNKMLITRSGVPLDEMTGKSAVEVDIDEPSNFQKKT
jgi:L-fuculose-phosphate aldolase